MNQHQQCCRQALLTVMAQGMTWHVPSGLVSTEPLASTRTPVSDADECREAAAAYLRMLVGAVAEQQSMVLWTHGLASS